MTRKRLVKMLMSQGISRNEANQMAARYRSIGMPYIMGHIDYLLEFNSSSVENSWGEMCRLRAEVEKQTGEKYRTFGAMAAAMLRIARE